MKTHTHSATITGTQTTLSPTDPGGQRRNQFFDAGFFTSGTAAAAVFFVMPPGIPDNLHDIAIYGAAVAVASLTRIAHAATDKLISYIKRKNKKS